MIGKNDFLTQNTADGLKITLQSTIDAVNYLLNEKNFAYVLTSKFNQDRLEVNILHLLIILIQYAPSTKCIGEKYYKTIIYLTGIFWDN